MSTGSGLSVCVTARSARRPPPPPLVTSTHAENSEVLFARARGRRRDELPCGDRHRKRDVEGGVAVAVGRSRLRAEEDHALAVPGGVARGAREEPERAAAARHAVERADNGEARCRSSSPRSAPGSSAGCSGRCRRRRRRLAVTPVGARSMPSSVFEKIELPRMARLPESTRTPA